MTRTNILYRPAGLALGLLILSATGGCAHFHNAEVRAQERAGVQRAEPSVAEAVPAPPVTPEPPTPAPALAVAPAPKVVVQATPAPPIATDSPAEPRTPVAPAPREPVPAPSRPASGVAPAPATHNAIIIFANTPSVNCGSCETLKISVAPSGQVLMERGSWTAGHSNWHYKRSRADVGPDRAAAFAGSLSADRPVGTQTIGGNCAAPATGDGGLSIEWIEADRDDRLTARFGCTAGGAVAERLRRAPDLLGLRQLALP